MITYYERGTAWNGQGRRDGLEPFLLDRTAVGAGETRERVHATAPAACCQGSGA